MLPHEKRAFRPAGWAVIALLFYGMLLSLGCNDATSAQWAAQGKRHRVTLYSGGVAVRTWTSTGSPINEEKSDGWYFEDQATHKLVEVTGTVVFEVAD